MFSTIGNAEDGQDIPLGVACRQQTLNALAGVLLGLAATSSASGEVGVEVLGESLPQSIDRIEGHAVDGDDVCMVLSKVGL